MKVLIVCLFCIFLLADSMVGEDTVAEDIGVHQLERLVEMLTPTECEDLLAALSQPEEDIFQHLERLTPEKNDLDLKPRAKRDTAEAADSEAQCRTALTDWLLRHGEETYYDRLTRALQRIGRTDVAIEVGKNINQEKALSLKRYVEDYHKYVNSLNLKSLKFNTKTHRDAGRKVKRRKVRDLTWRDLDLIVQRAAVPPYQKGLLDVVLPLVCGLLAGFGATLVLGVSLSLITVYICDRRSCPLGTAGSDLELGRALLGDDSYVGKSE
ncbi:transmembrane and death domain protein 1 [Salarias fasciatus]|uniref:transmembrane and death domain protein 1 n=1 Tax=Salarias fasciatus TaxID=181472 RepID=UPI0011767251|nr:uncharacterized protein C12orf81-like [Salarias fasciatus]